MSTTQTIVFCLDAFDAALSDKLIAEGRLKGLARLKANAARFPLEHGPEGKARYTGLTWEHFSSGRQPATSEKWSVITFDPATYGASQSHATETPFLAHVDAKCVVFDAPYWNMRAMPNGVGVVGWSGHDTGVSLHAQPPALYDEMVERFGGPLDHGHLNTMVYPSVEQTQEMAKDLEAEAAKRGDITEWLLSERFQEWDVAVIGFGETHDAIELFCHGALPDHPLAGTPSAEAARAGVIAVYEAVSAQIERVMDRFPDANFVAFTMHGMGENDTDVPTMLLLHEVLFRAQFDQPLFRSRDDWRGAEHPQLGVNEPWEGSVIQAMEHPQKSLAERAVRKAARVAKKLLPGAAPAPATAPESDEAMSVTWMPAHQYARYWEKMDAFALPAYFDGRVRVNLIGREAKGRVPIERYEDELNRIETLLRELRVLGADMPAVKEISRPWTGDPREMPGTLADLHILWTGWMAGVEHPKLGAIGPAPARRTGGHSGGYGALYIKSARLAPGEYPLRSSFDVAPSIIDLMGHVRPNSIDGESVLAPRSVAAE